MDDSTSGEAHPKPDGSGENSEQANVGADFSMTHDDQLFGPLADGERAPLSGTQMTPDCLRPDDVSLIVHAPGQASAPIREHLFDCDYCRLVVSAASSELKRHADFAGQLASPQTTFPNGERNKNSSRRIAGTIIRYGLPVALVVLFLFLAGPDSIRSMAPIGTWSGSLLNRRLDRAMTIGDENIRVAILSEKIDRQPNNHLLYLMRSQAQLRLGNSDLARSDWTICCSLSGMIDNDSEFESWSDEAATSTIPASIIGQKNRR